jgi:hypothetical protein
LLQSIIWGIMTKSLYMLSIYAIFFWIFLILSWICRCGTLGYKDLTVFLHITFYFSSFTSPIDYWCDIHGSIHTLHILASFFYFHCFYCSLYYYCYSNINSVSCPVDYRQPQLASPFFSLFSHLSVLYFYHLLVMFAFHFNHK